jgi:hypothetical protein
MPGEVSGEAFREVVGAALRAFFIV